MHANIVGYMDVIRNVGKSHSIMGHGDGQLIPKQHADNDLGTRKDRVNR